jgi:hypothetical protein
MLRDALAVERIGDTSGQDEPGRYSSRNALGRHKMLVAEIERVGDRRRLDPGAAVNEAKRHLSSGSIQCTAWRVGADGSHGDRLPLAAHVWQSADFVLITGGAVDLKADLDWADLMFTTTDRVIELWPETESVSQPLGVASSRYRARGKDECRDHLVKLMVSGPPARGQGKNTLRVQLVTKYGISGRQFDAEWKSALDIAGAHATWGKAGVRPQCRPKS